MNNMRHPYPLMRRVLKGAAAPQRQQAFTLVELLVGGVLSVLVVSSLAAVALIAELRMGRDAEVNQVLRDNWGRTMEFIHNEAQQAYWIRTPTDAAAYPCQTARTRLAGSPLLVLEGPPIRVNGENESIPAWNVVYAVMQNDEPSEWRGFNLLVRCGPPYEANTRPNTPEGLKRNAVGGNLAYCKRYVADSAACDAFAEPEESVITDQLAQTNPLRVSLYEPTLGKDREALLSLYLSRRSNPNLTYPPMDSLPGRAATPNAFLPGFQTQISTKRNPAFDLTEASACNTTLAGDGINQEPPANANCEVTSISILTKRNQKLKEYRLPNGADLQVNRCTLGANCEGPKSTATTDVIYLKGNFDDFTTNQFAKDNPSPCSRSRCYLSNGSQSVTIFDGNVLVFYDRIVRL